jgi:hypothetical protein
MARRTAHRCGLLRHRGSIASSCTPPRLAHRPLYPPSPPFHPGDGSMGRSKAHRWADEDSDAERTPTSYLDAVRLGSQVRSSPLPERVVTRPTIGGSRASAAAEQGKRPLPGTGAARGRRPRPKLVHGLPARPVEGRIPARQRLEHRERCSARRRIFTPDVEGWREVLSLALRGGTSGTHPTRPAPASQRPHSRYPADLHGKCFNCLSTAHRVATCRLPPRCLRCMGFRHLTQDCKQRRKVPSPGSRVVGAPDRRSVREVTPGYRPRALGDTPGAGWAAPGAAAEVPVAARCDGGWRRR